MPAIAGTLLRRDVLRPQHLVGDVLERHRHHSALAVDIDAAEKLQPETGRKILDLRRVAALLEQHARPECIVERRRMPGAGMQQPGYELIKRIEILKHRAV